MIYILPSNTTNLLTPTVHTTCFRLLRLSSGTEVQNLKPIYKFVKSTLKFLRSKKFYISTVYFNILHSSMALSWPAANILIEFIPLCWSELVVCYIYITVKYSRLLNFTNCKMPLARVHLDCKFCNSVLEDGRRRPKHVASIVRFNKFVVFHSNV